MKDQVWEHFAVHSGEQLRRMPLQKNGGQVRTENRKTGSLRQVDFIILAPINTAPRAPQGQM